ncbi:MAG: L-serine ammonia-lyase, iron-sulfur-dependent subunit beta [Cyanobacteria bacterium]|nr:L-serine ammonia-lyase, iron-sulfur-dependent subunit beta [Cyanobacteriota bacterium]
MMNHSSLFDIVGPIMVGPSSSHTAGAVRLANLARLIAEKPIQSVEFVLYNSFAKTYQGHGTDRGLIAGILGYRVDDPQIKDAFQLAETHHLAYQITPYLETNHYSPNTVVFHLTLKNPPNPETAEESSPEKLTVVGHSIGGGKVYVSKINEYNVSLKGALPTLILFYKDQPGMIWQVSKIIAERGINIASLQCSRNQRGVQAFMEICLDSLLPQEAVEQIRAIPNIYTVKHIDKLN